MARIITLGWETGTLEELPLITSGSVDSTTGVNTTTVRSGVYSLKVDYSANAGASFAQRSYRFYSTGAALNVTLYVRFYLYYTAAPTIASLVFRTANAGTFSAHQRAGVGLNTDGRVQLYTNDSTSLGSASSVLTTNVWHLIEVSSLCDGVNQTLSLTVDGTSVDSQSVASTTNETVLSFGWSIPINTGQNSGTYYLDDIAINDSSGASQNVSPGASKIICLLPMADNAIGTGWTTSGAASSNLYTNVDNTPPTGIADTTANEGHQIRNATSNANSAYDAQVTDYATAGIAAADTINVVQVIVSTAAPVSTGAKAGTVGCVSNPSGSMGNLSTGGTSGAFWSGTAAGTFPTGWKWSYGPAVAGDIAAGNRSTRPVIRINQVTSSTRIAMVDFLGLYVDYIPAVTPALVWKPRVGPNYRR